MSQPKIPITSDRLGESCGRNNQEIEAKTEGKGKTKLQKGGKDKKENENTEK